MNKENPVVTLTCGKLRGQMKIDWIGQSYYSFQGIPYGKPPIGALRFKAPLPAEPWLGIKDVHRHGNESYARNYENAIIGSEDCLFLNVYTPALPQDTSELKPVMVWIHGGGFTKGSGSSYSYGPDFLVSEDVVLVTINYRLGLLGFASFEDPSLDIPGNAGMKDQVLALKWVQTHISKFSGDPNNVTIFGESVGGCSVHCLMLSPMAAGACHADEIGYLFFNAATPHFSSESQEGVILRRMIKLWTTFAKYGNPNPVIQDPLINITWLPVTKEKQNYLEIGENLTCGIDPESERMRFWDDIYSSVSDII